MITYQIRSSVVGEPKRITVRALRTDDEALAVEEFDKVCGRLANAPETWLVELQAVMTTTMSRKSV